MLRLSFWFYLGGMVLLEGLLILFNPVPAENLTATGEHYRAGAGLIEQIAEPAEASVLPIETPEIAGASAIAPLEPEAAPPVPATAPTTTVSSEPPKPSDPSPVNCNAGLAVHVLEKVNDFRLAQGKSEFYGNAAYDNFACAHSQEMARAGYFSHSDAAGRSFAERVSASGLPIWRENLAQAGNPTDIARLWEKSAGHRENILQSEGKVGVGVVSSGGTLTVTMVFGD